MKKLIPVLVAVVFAGSASAGSIYNGIEVGNSDLYPENVESHDSSLPLAVQPGTGDSYGGNAASNTHLEGFVKARAGRDNFNDIVYGSWAEGIEDLD